jgi:hypothetical protein
VVPTLVRDADQQDDIAALQLALLALPIGVNNGETKSGADGDGVDSSDFKSTDRPVDQGGQLGD